MNETQKIPWKRVSVEAAAIVASILLAFAIEAWWDSKQQAALERELLGQLQSELTANAVILAEQRRLHVQTHQALQRLSSLSAPNTSLEETNEDQVIADLFEVQDWWTIDLQMGVLTSLLSSGNLGIIQSNALRNSIAVFPSIVKDFIDEENTGKEFARNSVIPYLIEHSNLRAIQHHGDADADTFSIDIEELLRERVFDNLLSERLVQVESIFDSSERLESHIDQLSSQIGEYLL